jgi:mannose-6-phosphate isomerase
MRPRRLTPRFLQKVWGSTRLEPWFRDSDRKIGEVWFEGVDSLPLLVKFIFTSEKLSVQVHPNDEYARVHHQSLGKTEMWHILAAEPGAKIAAGFREELSEQQLTAAARSGEIEDLLEWFEAKPGDTFYIPAGTVHAIGAGLALCEIQEHSDVTYRLYDYGRPRELHLNRAVEVSDRGPIAARAGDRVCCTHFTTSRFTVDSKTSFEPKGVEILIAIEGTGSLDGSPFKAGEAWYLPVDCAAFEMSGDAVFLRTGLGSGGGGSRQPPA